MDIHQEIRPGVAKEGLKSHTQGCICWICVCLLVQNKQLHNDFDFGFLRDLDEIPTTGLHISYKALRDVTCGQTLGANWVWWSVCVPLQHRCLQKVKKRSVIIQTVISDLCITILLKTLLKILQHTDIGVTEGSCCPLLLPSMGENAATQFEWDARASQLQQLISAV